MSKSNYIPCLHMGLSVNLRDRVVVLQGAETIARHVKVRDVFQIIDVFLFVVLQREI